MTDLESLRYITNITQYILQHVTSNNGNGFAVFKLVGKKLQPVPEILRPRIGVDDQYQIFINGTTIESIHIEVVDALNNTPLQTDTLFKLNLASLEYLLDDTDEVIVIGHFEES